MFFRSVPSVTINTIIEIIIVAVALSIMISNFTESITRSYILIADCIASLPPFVVQWLHFHAAIMT